MGSSGSDRTGVRAVDKRDGGGAYNWGSMKDQIEEETVVPEEKADTADEGIGVSGDESGPENKEPEEPVELTLAEYRAQMKRTKPEFKRRQAGEGENNDKWKSTYVLEKKDKAEKEKEKKEKKGKDKLSDDSS